MGWQVEFKRKLRLYVVSLPVGFFLNRKVGAITNNCADSVWMNGGAAGCLCLCFPNAIQRWGEHHYLTETG